jgi:TatD DNase family protein
MLADAHIHLAELLERDPGFPGRLALASWIGCAASHDESEFARTAALKEGAWGRLSFVTSFGIHPQCAVWKNADFLSSLAASGRIQAIGEAGFDFFGDRPERIRNEENERAQRAVFEFQLDLAERHALPILLHLRKAMDLAFEYAPRLKRLPAAIFHSYSGSARDGEALVRRGVPAYFSFGAPPLNGNKRSAEACALAPAERLLVETDAPWQPPKGEPFCRWEHLRELLSGIAAIRGVEEAALEDLVLANFERAYGLEGG